jgi:hypothetical protein|tara:strand:- start:4575 stop:4706 length:132 start_codon:yes stop_codon:yes gene_type:complete
MFKNKKAFIMSPGDFIKGIIIGVIVGAAIVYLGTTGILPIPFL